MTVLTISTLTIIENTTLFPFLDIFSRVMHPIPNKAYFFGSIKLYIFTPKCYANFRQSDVLNGRRIREPRHVMLLRYSFLQIP